MAENRRIILARRPNGMPTPDDFAVDSAPTPEPGDGEIVIANRVLSIDPAIRGWLDDRESYMPPLALGDPIRSMTLGEVVASRNPNIPVGAVVRGLAAWEEYSLVGDALGLEVLDLSPRVALEDYMGALGPAGLTAWVGLRVIAEAKAGDTVLVSAAAGAVGSLVGQIARILGCRIIGLASSDDKLRVLKNIGFDGVINYRTTPDLAAAIRETAPNGIDVYFDNVGGRILEAVLPQMRLGGRVAVCGMIGDYNNADNPYGVKTLWRLVVSRLTLRGFLTYDHADRLCEAREDLERWTRDGTLKPLNNVRDGLSRAPEAFIDMLSGGTVGKTLVRLRKEGGKQ